MRVHVPRHTYAEEEKQNSSLVIQRTDKRGEEEVGTKNGDVILKPSISRLTGNMCNKEIVNQSAKKSKK